MKRITLSIISILLLLSVAVACGGEEEATPSPTTLKQGWCCRDGMVLASFETLCLETGGQFFTTQEQALEFCQAEFPQEGWCCRDGEVFASSEPVCLETGGSFFLMEEQALESCQAEFPRQGWCCRNGEVFASPDHVCLERGGDFFPTREAAEEYCAGVTEHPGIGDLKGPHWRDYIGRQVTVEAIFVRDPLPMLVTDLDIVIKNERMPYDQYIILVGEEAELINSKEYGGAKLQLSGQVIEVEDLMKYGNEHVAIAHISYEMLDRLTVYSPDKVRIPIDPQFEQPDSYAVLFSGGIDKANNHDRYWNDLKFMYSTLINEYGFMANHIAVLYADGKAEDQDMPVHYSGTQTNLETVFNLLRKNSTTQDLIFFFTTNHGGGFRKDRVWNPISGGRFDAGGDEGQESLSESTYNMDLNGNGNQLDQVSWDEDLDGWGEDIFDDSFDTILANLQYDRMIIVMEQCFSGGLIADMARSGTNRIIMSAAGEYEPSSAMPPSYTYDEFSYYFTCAINGADPDGNPVDADTNNDGEVSMVEAFNYARSNDTRSETPWYEDSGDGIPHSGSMPAGGDGALGSNTAL